jgi:hypothetical protein
MKIKKIMADERIGLVGKVFYFAVELFDPGDRPGGKEKLPFPGTFFNLVNDDICIGYSPATQFRYFLLFFLSFDGFGVGDLFKWRKVDPIENLLEHDGTLVTGIFLEALRNLA